MTLSCKHVDDVVIGAPYILTKDLIKSLNISKVVNIIETEEDKVLQRFENIDPFEVAKKMGIYVEEKVEDDFYDITTEKIASRVLTNKVQFELKVKKKSSS